MQTIQNMITFEFNIFDSNRNKHICKMMSEGNFVWNHALAIQKRYYSLYGGYVDLARMKKHFAEHIKRYRLHSQTVQEVLERLDESYQRFFKHLAKRPPKFKKASQFSSLVFKQGGYKLYANILIINKIKKHFKFSYSRPIDGNVRTVRIKRVQKDKYRLYVVTDKVSDPYHKTHDGAMVGMDFGLKTYLTLSDGTTVENPEFLKSSLKELERASKALSRTKKGSNHHEARRKELKRCHERIKNRRNDWQWKTAHDLCRRYDIICIEDLNISAMTRLWGRKVNDLAFTSFVEKLEHVAMKYGCEVRKVDRYYASSKTCGNCHKVYKDLTLKDRTWTCPECGAVLDRDLNAAKNILRQGTVSCRSPRKTKVTLRKGRKSLQNLTP